MADDQLPLGSPGGPAGGQITVSPTPPSVPAPADTRVAGLQSYYDSQLAALGWGNLQRVPAAREVQELTSQAQRAKELETQMQQYTVTSQQLAAQKDAADQALLQAQFQNRKLQALVRVNPALVPLAGSIDVPLTADDAAIQVAATAFLENLKALGFAPAGSAAPAASTPLQPIAPPPPSVPGGTPPAGQVGTIDERVRMALRNMWDAKDPAAYKAAEDVYFTALDEKKTVEGWVDTKWGKPPGWE